MSKYTEAVECFDKALAINPKSVDVLNNKGVTLSMRGLYKEAIACFEQAHLAGSVFGGGVDAVGTIKGNPALKEAYELGKQV